MWLLFLMAVGFSSATYCLGKAHGWEECEKVDQESKAFWKEVEKRGL